ncbi:MAG: hypothetical protein Q9Q13_03255 [Acidobacteriota bacterium]|nr:hypothetical protein [Acidobacteriota bacterium]
MDRDQPRRGPPLVRRDTDQGGTPPQGRHPASGGAPPPQPPADLASRGDERLFIVQFRTRSLPEWRGSLAAAGAEVLAYFPYNAHIVRADPAVIERVASRDFVERVLPYEPAWRLSPELRAWVEGSGEPRRRRVRLMAFEWGSAGKSRIAAAAQALGAEIFTNWPSGHIIEIDLDRDQLRRLAHHDDVMWADPWSAPETDMDLVREDAGTNWVENNFGYCGQGRARRGDGRRRPGRPHMGLRRHPAPRRA